MKFYLYLSALFSFYTILHLLFHTFLFLVTVHLSYFNYYILDLLYLVPDPSRLLSLIFIPIFISDFILHFYWYSIYSINLYVDTTIYSSVLILDSVFRLLIFSCYLTTWTYTHLVLHQPLLCLSLSSTATCICTLSQVKYYTGPNLSAPPIFKISPLDKSSIVHSVS